MMDKTYIQEHGILELYVLGELNESEQKQLEQALISFPELKSDLSEIEDNFERLAFENAIQPDENVKLELLKHISKSDSKVITLHTPSRSRKLMRIASGIAAVFLIGLVYFYAQWNSTQNELKLVKDQNSELNKKLDQLNTDYNITKSLFTSINDPNTEKYILKGNRLSPEAKLISYVNDVEKTVVVNTTYLPKLDTEHDYQMWADVNGEMINMGIIDTEKPMLAMNYIDNSESLNITIEPLGGSDHPTVTQLISNLYIN